MNVLTCKSYCAFFSKFKVNLVLEVSCFQNCSVSRDELLYEIVES
jgi:hypothetical protein